MQNDPLHKQQHKNVRVEDRLFNKFTIPLYITSSTLYVALSSIYYLHYYFFLKKWMVLMHHGHIKLIKSDSKHIYNVQKISISNKCCYYEL